MVLTLSPRFLLDRGYNNLIEAKHLQYSDPGFTPADLFKNIKTTVFYNDQCLASHSFEQCNDLTLDHNFADDKNQPKHELLLCFEGLNIHNNFMAKNQEVSLGIQLTVVIEGIDLSWYLNSQTCFVPQNKSVELGRTFVSENGQLQIAIRTPIYVWLFEHENLVIDQFYQTL